MCEQALEIGLNAVCQKLWSVYAIKRPRFIDEINESYEFNLAKQVLIHFIYFEFFTHAKNTEWYFLREFLAMRSKGKKRGRRHFNDKNPIKSI